MYAIVIEVYPEPVEGLVVEAGNLAVEFARCPTALDELELIEGSLERIADFAKHLKAGVVDAMEEAIWYGLPWFLRNCGQWSQYLYFLIFNVLENCGQWLQFLNGYVCRPLHLTLEVAKNFALKLRIDTIECAILVESSPFHPLAVDAFGEGLEELFTILCAIGSVLLELNDVEADEPVAGCKHAVDGMGGLLTESFVNLHDAIGKLPKGHCTLGSCCHWLYVIFVVGHVSLYFL